MPVCVVSNYAAPDTAFGILGGKIRSGKDHHTAPSSKKMLRKYLAIYLVPHSFQQEVEQLGRLIQDLDKNIQGSTVKDLIGF